jgi:predicted transcriptional regulator of viral defense system
MSKVYKKFAPQKVVRRKQVLDYFSGNTERTNAALRWLTGSGKAQRIKTGLYYFKQPDEWYKDEVFISQWIVASNAVQNGVIGYHSALHLLGYAYSEVKDVQTVIGRDYSRVPRAFTYQGVNYKYFRDDLSYGITLNVLADTKVKIFDIERVVLEGLMQPNKFYGMAEFLNSVNDIKWLDLDHLFEMVDNYPLPSVSMRLGWLLEKYKRKWYVEDSYLKKLRVNRPEDRVFLVNRQRNGNVLHKTWNLMVSKNLLTLEE